MPPELEPLFQNIAPLVEPAAIVLLFGLSTIMLRWILTRTTRDIRDLIDEIKRVHTKLEDLHVKLENLISLQARYVEKVDAMIFKLDMIIRITTDKRSEDDA